MQKYLILFLLFPSISFAQFDYEKDVLDYLSGNQSKIWFAIPYNINSAGTGSCKEGKSYNFKRSKSVKIKECINGKWIEKEFPYTLQMESPYDWWIKFDNKRYYLVMLNRGTYLETKLRTSQSLNEKIDESKDIILIHNKDDD